MRLVTLPAAKPREADLFPFRRAVALSTGVLLVLALGAAQWMVRRHLAEAKAENPAASVMVQSLHTPEEDPAEPSKEPILERRENVPPPAPRANSLLAVPALTVEPEELVDQQWENEIQEPFDSEVSEADNEPFPTARIEPAKPEPPKRTAKQTPKPSTRPSKPRPASRPSSKPAVRAAQVLRRAQPNYPTSARRAGVEGRVVLTVQVRTDGRVGSVRVSRSSGSAALDSAAISAVKRWSATCCGAG